MASEISKTQIDRLGDRLKKGEITDNDLRLLDEYRRSFSEAYEFVIVAIRNELGLEPTGRPAKSTISISDKLLRESIRLSQIQDVAGCRLVVSEIVDQNRAVESLKGIFDNANIVDRREHPSHGYRAVHVIVRYRHTLVEIQVRTLLQQAWAELSEKLSDINGTAIKYGKGNKTIMEPLLQMSAELAKEEANEAELTRLEAEVSVLLSAESTELQKQDIMNVQRELKKLQQKQRSLRNTSLKILRDTLEQIQ